MTEQQAADMGESARGVWHLGHIMGGYQNPKCPSRQREMRAEAKEKAKRGGRAS